MPNRKTPTKPRTSSAATPGARASTPRPRRRTAAPPSTADRLAAARRESAAVRRVLRMTRAAERLARQVPRALDRIDGAIAELMFSAARRRGLVVLNPEQKRLDLDHLADAQKEVRALRARIAELERQISPAPAPAPGPQISDTAITKHGNKLTIDRAADDRPARELAAADARS